MSLELSLFCVALGLALALLSVRRWLDKSGVQRRRHSALLAVGIFFGLLAGRALHQLFAETDAPWVTWPLGPLGGIALVELGTPVLSGIRTGLKVAAEAIGRRFGGGR
jgi:hypothetical protein